MSSSTLYVPKRRHPELIGKGAATLHDLQDRFKVKILVPSRDEESNEVVVSGKPEDVAAVRAEIEHTLKINTKEPALSWKLQIPPQHFGHLIGPGGSTLHNLQDQHHVRINVPKQGASDEHVVVEGSESEVNALIPALESLLKIKVHRPSHPDGASPAPARNPSFAVSSPPAASGPSGPIDKVIFFPDKDPVHCPNIHEFLSYLGSPHATLEICVFTITDDRIASSIIKSHAKGVKVRVITDNDQAEQLGSDIQKFRDAGIAVKMDVSPYHMHHKFAIIDGSLLLNGSFNWTRGASQNNCENIMITNNTNFVHLFATQFETMWKDNVNFK